ncbi:Metallo-beta-lactamase family protein,RNA-specific [Candidatus Phaeomarinobacter ectocarpi]|uniref:Metallo-beta-lactamase family protein,RNA-specific n=1 Tax=Candidatus Phaeomarinibacter ectocarpi TaxID=1458461 RepID=X5M6Y0_9HYPH|nr:MBL fold metallo-hydrolase [Candidatus Phaeomarinobacter ectocarpi]CDO58828.1 Metallo-beta-lactamase family protein,RNA-specific [Candidatus Phaeomarinobacter ectocarpi]
MKVTFNGAAQEVTGSCTLVETDSVRFLVDCGMFQGGRDADSKNHAPFSFDPGTIDFVLLTHAHIDHSGLLPKLRRHGFTGPVYTSHATADLLDIMLRDSAHIQQSEAERAKRKRQNHKKKSNGQFNEPAYTIEDVEAVLEQVRSLDYDEPASAHETVRFQLRDAGHILGSAIIEIWLQESDAERKLVFSGDLGQPDRPILCDPTMIEEADILFIESTYGDRQHKNLDDTIEEFVSVVTHTLNDLGGNIIVPAFAVGRTQEIIYYVNHLTRIGRLQNINLFVDSPMATAVTRLTMQHLELFDAQSRNLAAWQANGDGVPNVTFTGSVDESRAINTIQSGAMIVSASGMCTAGRIKHHLRHGLPRPQNAVLITGFQAEGTLGRRLVDGAHRVRIFGEDVTVRASVHTLGGFSAHADQAALLNWLSAFKHPPKQTFVMHGEPGASSALADEISNRLGWQTQLPEHGESFVLLPV